MNQFCAGLVFESGDLLADGKVDCGSDSRFMPEHLRTGEKPTAVEGSKLEGHKGPSSINGIGKITEAILLSVIGDVNDFADEGHLASCFGIVPRVSNSNETEHSGRIHKRGTKLGRTALVAEAMTYDSRWQISNRRPALRRTGVGWLVGVG